MTTKITNTEKFLRELLSCAVEGGINYWAHVQTLIDAETRTAIRARIYSHEDGEWFTIDTNTIAEGITKTLRKDMNPQLRKALATMGAEGDYDAADADEIVQRALFGERIYG